MKPKTDKRRQAVNQEQTKHPPKEDSSEDPIEKKIDLTLEHSFPASDPPSWTLGVKKRRRRQEER